MCVQIMVDGQSHCVMVRNAEGTIESGRRPAGRTHADAMTIAYLRRDIEIDAGNDVNLEFHHW
jgi:hypothetical protein